MRVGPALPGRPPALAFPAGAVHIKLYVLSTCLFDFGSNKCCDFATLPTRKNSHGQVQPVH